jgi:hypothetical protein
MCLSAAAMMAISAGVNVVGQLQQGAAARAAGDAQAQQDERLAAQQRDQAQGEAERIRRAGARQQGAARAQFAASGVDVNSNAPLQIEEFIGRESERDAMNVLLTGQRQSDASLFNASQARARGVNAQRASVLGAISTGLQGWKGVKQPAPDPLGDFYSRGTRGSGD